MFGLDFIRRLKACKWRYEPPLDDGVEHFGFIAQEVEEIAPRHDYAFVVKTNGVYGLRMSEFIGPIVKAIQELDDKVNVLNERINEISRKD